MSVVAVKIEKDKITIGADSIIIISESTQEKNKLAKLYQNDWMVVGDVGDAQEGALFQIFSKTRKPKTATVEAITEYMFDFFSWKKEKTDINELESEYIIIFNKKVFLIVGFYVREITDYAAIGAGMDFALAALYLNSDIKTAIETACHLSTLCEKPVNLIEIKK